ncbi:hypothetical protein BO99DRAFT_306317, partial [Aspergillus violaceofuscus CBS 115571]
TPTLTLHPATLAEHATATHLNSTAWKTPLTTTTYLAREQALLSQPLAANGNLTCWILIDPTNPGQILSACETYRRRALVARHGTLHEVTGYGIANLYSRPELRRQGYASRMLRALMRRLAGPGAGDARFVMGYSEIGTGFYHGFGGRGFPVVGWGWEVPADAAAAAAAAQLTSATMGEEGVQVRDLLAEDVRVCMCSDVVLGRLRERLRCASLREGSSSGGGDDAGTPAGGWGAGAAAGAVQFAILPSWEHFAWFQAREDLTARLMEPPRPVPLVRGAADDEVGVYCAWNHEYGDLPENGVLYILYWVCGKGDEEGFAAESAEGRRVVRAIAGILRRAQREACEAGLRSVRMWNPTSLIKKAVEVVAGEQGVPVVVGETGSIPGLWWMGLEGDVEGGSEERVEWVCNEKYAWC